MKVEVHLHFDGNCQAAFEFYAQLFKAKAPSLLSYADSPAAESVPEKFKDKIVHASVEVEGLIIAGADVPSGYQRPEGFNLLVQLGTDQECSRIFNGLAEKGEIEMPLQKTFWTENYGIVRDRFGIPWEVNQSA